MPTLIDLLVGLSFTFQAEVGGFWAVSTWIYLSLSIFFHVEEKNIKQAKRDSIGQPWLSVLKPSTITGQKEKKTNQKSPEAIETEID